MRILIDVLGGKVGMVWATDKDGDNEFSKVYVRYDCGKVETVPEWLLDMTRGQLEGLAELEDGPNLALYDEQQAERDAGDRDTEERIGEYHQTGKAGSGL